MNCGIIKEEAAVRTRSSMGFSDESIRTLLSLLDEAWDEDDIEWCVSMLLDVSDEALPRIKRRLPSYSRLELEELIVVITEELIRACVRSEREEDE